MKIDSGISGSLHDAPGQAATAEAAGYDAAWSSETSHDPMFPLVLAAEHTSRLQLGTAITVAFARNPMTLAQAAWDLNTYSGGRFLLGLGSQIKPHIEKRFSMPWSHPAARMREFILAMRAIWDCWQNGSPLQFRGDFYTHTIMTPFFNPGPNGYGAPKVFLAAVGEGMTRVAAEAADGMLVHGFTTERYLREVTIPAIEDGLTSAGRSRADFELSYPVFIVTGETDEQFEAAAAGTRKQIAFYASTPAYKSVLDLHGWGDLQGDLNALSKRGEWDEMGRRIDDEILDAFAVVGPTDKIPALVRGRLEGVVDRISFYMPYKDTSGNLSSRLLAEFKTA